MEDIIFSILEPNQYKNKKLVKSSKKDRNNYISNFINPIEKELKNINIEANVFGRAKHHYSINNKK